MGIKRFPARPRAAAAYLAARLKRAGQVTVELLLVLPVFMLLLFFIMEMGNLGFHTILAHHCAYEMARVGSLVAGPNAGNISAGSDNGSIPLFRKAPGQRHEIGATLGDDRFNPGAPVAKQLHHARRQLRSRVRARAGVDDAGEYGLPDVLIHAATALL